MLIKHGQHVIKGNLIMRPSCNHVFLLVCVQETIVRKKSLSFEQSLVSNQYQQCVDNNHTSFPQTIRKSEPKQELDRITRVNF